MLRLQEKGAGSSSWGSKYKQHKGPARMPLGNQPGAKATQKMHQASEDLRPVKRQLCAASKASSRVSNITAKKVAAYKKINQDHRHRNGDGTEEARRPGERRDPPRQVYDQVGGEPLQGPDVVVEGNPDVVARAGPVPTCGQQGEVVVKQPRMEQRMRVQRHHSQDC